VSVPVTSSSRMNRVRMLKKQAQESREDHWRRMDVMAGDMEQQAMYTHWQHGRNTQHWYRRRWTHGPRLVSTHTHTQTHTQTDRQTDRHIRRQADKETGQSKSTKYVQLWNLHSY